MNDTILTLPIPSSNKPMRWRHLYGSGLGFAVSCLAAESKLIVVATKDMRSAASLETQIRFFLRDESIPLLSFPDWECLPYDNFSPHPDIISQRLLTLHRLPHLKKGIAVLPVSNLMQKLPPLSYVDSYSFVLSLGDNVNITELRNNLINMAYQNVSQVLSPGEFCIRGGIIDIFPMGSSQPFRIDFFGDEIDGIRYFDPTSQKSTKNLDHARLLPAREFPINEQAIKLFRKNFRSQLDGDPRKSSIYTDVSQGLAPSGIEYYFPLFFTNTNTLADYLPEGTLFIIDDEFEKTCESNFAEIHNRYDTVRVTQDNPILEPQKLYLRPEEVIDQVNQFKKIQITVFDDPDETSLPIRPPPQFFNPAHADKTLENFINYIHQFTGRVLIVAESPGRREVLDGILRNHDLIPRGHPHWESFIDSDDKLGITVDRLEQGLVLNEPSISVITENQIFGQRVIQRRRRGKSPTDPDAIIRSLAELELGDPVVHEDHGVGRYKGLKSLNIDGNETEFLTIEYYGADKLYIPILSLHAVSRYIGAGPETAPLHKLGSEQWLRARNKAKEKAYDIAAELLETQALRDSHKGTIYPSPDDAYQSFAEGFIFEETPDQAQAIDEIIADMQTNKPMDRLVCGDVGFGKTEVALRAAFIAVNGGKQVAVLVPTTLLAQQHYETFSDRFANFPIKIELLSRFRTQKEIAEILKLTKNGQVDILIGTHRLLQNDVSFKDIGFVIIDEEHRFGVRQKERLKQLRAEVDVLTLTATPIPRTLNSALSSLRDISIIGTPPKARLSVKTFVREWNPVVLREACLREIRRGGQIYFLHNEVKTIEKYKEQLQELIPEASIEVAHGQLPERELERIMGNFYHQRFNLLLCTTIIESGIDVPTANTIIIRRADRFGLAQLHQLRGRVGRSHHQAYAYLLTPPRKSLTGDALKRLQAIEALDDLGVGFALASHDLEIRGAGEILGEAQSGTIDEVGFTMYTEFLKRAIETLRNTNSNTLPGVEDQPKPCEINLHLPALLPETYLPDVHQRLVCYKRIANCQTIEELNDLQAETIDRFGLLPEPAKTLFRSAELSIRVRGLGMKDINIGPLGGRIVFQENTPVDPIDILKLIQVDSGKYRMQGTHTLTIKDELPDELSRIACIDSILEYIGLT